MLKKWIILLISCMYFCGQIISLNEETQPIDFFLNKSGIWEGEFANFVFQEGRTIQKGRIRLKMTVSDNGIIKQSIALFDQDGNQGDYEGYATMKKEGDKLKWTGSITVDENTGNPIENHVFEGYIGWNQIYIGETYEEIYPDGRKEKRKNNIHYVILSDKKLLMLADVHVDGNLLVFANTVLLFKE
jgi:hypothetical protein